MHDSRFFQAIKRIMHDWKNSGINHQACNTKKERACLNGLLPSSTGISMLFLTGHQFMHANSSWWPVIRSMHDIYFSGHLIFFSSFIVARGRARHYTGYKGQRTKPTSARPRHRSRSNVERCVQSGDDWYLRLDIISPVVYTSLSSLSTGE